MSVTQWLEMTQKGGQLKRFHAFPIIGHESVAEHSFGVAMMVLALTDWKADARLIKAALYHDLAEQDTGDVPFQVKQADPMLKCKLESMEEVFNVKWGLHQDLPAKDLLVLKWGDMLQLLMFCKQQRDLGNRKMNEVFARGVEFLTGMETVPNGPEILSWLVENYAA